MWWWVCTSGWLWWGELWRGASELGGSGGELFVLYFFIFILLVFFNVILIFLYIILMYRIEK